MKIKVFGPRTGINSTERLERGFVNLGCELSDKPDCVYHSTGLYSDAEEFCSKLSYRPFKIYSLLDLDTGKNNFDEFYKDAKRDLESADIICAISNVVKNQMRDILGIKKDIEIVRYPIKPITKSNRSWAGRGITYLYVGRLNTNQKRFQLVYDFYHKYEVGNHLVVAGPEGSPVGRWFNSPTDEQLNEIYGDARFVLCPSVFEGLGLMCAESVISGSFPIVCKDNPVVYELGLEEYAADPSPEGFMSKMIEISNNQGYYRGLADKLRARYLNEFTVDAICKRILNLYYHAKSINV